MIVSVPLRTRAWILAALILASGMIFSSRARADEFRQTSKYQVRLFSFGTFALQARFGNIEIRAWDEPTVKIRAVKLVRAGSRRKAAKLYSRIRIRLTGRDKWVRLDTLYPARRPWRPFRDESILTVNYHIRMPYDANLTLKCVDGDVTVHGVTGQIRLRVTYGDVEISIPTFDELRSLNARSWLGLVQSEMGWMARQNAGFGKTLRYWNPSGKQDVLVRVGMGGIMIYDEL